MDNVNYRHPDYDRMFPKWKRCRDVIAGQDAVHDAGTEYLPKLGEQEQSDYDAYRKRAGFYNATWRTVSGLLGMMFRKPPSEELPGNVATYAMDIDLAGTHIDTLARDVALEIISVGRVAIMVDAPANVLTGPVSLAAAERAGIRPKLAVYNAETLINWKYARIRNRFVLVMAVLEEKAEEAIDEFKSEMVDQWRVLDLDEAGMYRQRIFRKAGVNDVGKFVQVGEDIYPAMAGQKMDFIPLYVIGTDGIDSGVDEPPMIDLVDVNLSHYRTTADYEHGCHFTGLPTAVVSGHNSGTDSAALYIGSTTAWVFSDPQARAQYLEFTGQGLGALRDNLDRKEQQMAILGARMIAQEKRQAETATTAAIHRTGENSVLASIALAVSDAMEKALAVFARWANVSGTATYQISRDYNPAMLDAAQMTAIMKAVQTGLMSPQSFHELMQRADVIDSAVSFEDEQERISATALPAPVVDDAAQVAA